MGKKLGFISSIILTIHESAVCRSTSTLTCHEKNQKVDSSSPETRHNKKQILNYLEGKWKYVCITRENIDSIRWVFYIVDGYSTRFKGFGVNE